MTSTTVQMATETTVVQVVDGEATVVQTGVPVTVTTTGGGGVTDATYVTLSTNGTLTDERVLTAGTGITITDAGAGSTVTVGVTANTYQPLDSDLTAIAALSTTSFGRALLELADAAAGRTALGLGSLATASTITTSEITDGTIVNADISASAAIALSKLSTTGSPSSANFLRGDGAWTVVPTPYLVSFVPWLGSVSNTNWDTRTQTTSAIGNGYLNSTGAQNAEVTFNVALAAGTWKLKILYAASTGGGIYTVSLDGSSIGTIDCYNGSTTYNNVGTISGFTVSAPGIYALNFKMATKNASSSNYFAFLQHVALLRTGA